jgi:metal-sulfur cluster biosynthetic enzyme
MSEITQDRTGRDAAALDAVAPDVAAPSAEPAALPALAAPDNGMDVELVEEIEEALRDVVDPELGVNIVDLGLVYDMSMAEQGVLTIDMTLTSAACPLTDMIEDQINAALLGEGSIVAGDVTDFTINWVWLPPWGPERITDDGRDQLRALGFNI